MTIDLNSIKTENIKAVFSAVNDGEVVSRAEIAETTSLSLVTVGKIADALIAANALREEKRVLKAAGRRAGMLSFNSDKFAIVIDRSGEGTTVTFYSIRKTILEKLDFDADTSVDDIFAGSAAILLNKCDIDCCIGVCIISDDGSEWGMLEEKTKAFFPDLRYVIAASVHAATLSTSCYSASYKLCMYLSVRRGHIRGAFIMNGQFVPRQHERYSDFGVIRISDGESLIERVSKTNNYKEYVGVLGGSIFNASRITYPDRVVVEIEDREDAEEVVDEIREYINKRCAEIDDTPPEIICPDKKIKCSHYGALKMLGEKWIDAIVDGN